MSQGQRGKLLNNNTNSLLDLKHSFSVNFNAQVLYDMGFCPKAYLNLNLLVLNFNLVANGISPTIRCSKLNAGMKSAYWSII